MTTSLRAVLFDMDGTLLDSEPLWDVSLSELAQRLGGSLTSSTRQRVVGSDLRDAVKMMHQDLGIVAGVEGEDESMRWLLNRTTDLFSTRATWMPNALTLVRAVRDASLATALVTSSRRVLVEAALRQWPPGMFDAIVCSDMVRNPKPHPESYLTAAAQLSVPPQQCVALEDSARGAASAHSAGCTVIAIGTELPSATPADVLVPTLASVSVSLLHRALETAHARE